MPGTIRQIARISGVSRETVERALREKEGVDPELALGIKKIARELGYDSRSIDAVVRNNHQRQVIGVVLCSEGNPFFDDLIRGLYMAREDLKSFGLTMVLRTMRGYDVNRQIEMIEEIEDQITGLLLQPINNARIVQKIDALYQRNILTVTVNTDIQYSKRLCYVGADYYHGGCIAGNLAGLLSNGRGNVGIVAGASNILGHLQRVNGFQDTLMRRYPGLCICHKESDHDDPETATAITLSMLQRYPEIDLLYVAAAGIYGTGLGVQAAHKERSVRIIGFDSVPTTIDMMERGVVQAIIYQQPLLQGFKALKLLFYHLITGKAITQEYYIINSEIKIAENVFDDNSSDFLMGGKEIKGM